MRITKINISNFKAFHSDITINLGREGKNLLLYGENGSGKSSLFQALNLFFFRATPLSIPPNIKIHKNIFNSETDVSVNLEIGDGINPSTIYEWNSDNPHPPTDIELISNATKTKGFFDYKQLLETYFINQSSDNINFYHLLVFILLANYKNPVSNSYFSEDWKKIDFLLNKRKSKIRDDKLIEMIDYYNTGLFQVLPFLSNNANLLLSSFDKELKIELIMNDRGISISGDKKSLENEKILLKVHYHGKAIDQHHTFLNEARLSAIAISIYLGSLLINPPSALRLLFLDDLLIGLDMSNRLPLLNILNQYFDEWQIIITTFDRVWFEMAKKRVEFWRQKWICAELYCEGTAECDIPVYAECKRYLDIAQKHLNENDLKATAVYIRCEFEYLLRWFTDKHSIMIKYKENRKDQNTEDFWLEILNCKNKTTKQQIIGQELKNKIELFRFSVLNKLAHDNPINLVRAEVFEAMTTISELKNTLVTIEKGEVCQS